MKKNKIRNLTYLSLLIAVEIAMVSVPFLGFIPIGPLKATTLHIPVIIAGIVLGKKHGSYLGLVFGICSIIMNTISPTITSFVFSPFLSGNILSAAIAIIPRVMIGFVAGSVYESFKGKYTNISIIVSSLLGAMSNSILVLSGIYFIFGNQYANVIGKSLSALMPYFIGIITTQSILEAIVGTIIAFAVSKALLRIK